MPLMKKKGKGDEKSLEDDIERRGMAGAPAGSNNNNKR